MKKRILSLVLMLSLVLISFNVFAADGDLIVNGKVGIGTTSPGASTKLDVNGAMRLNGDLTFLNDQTAYFIHGAANGGAIRIRSNGAANTDRNVQLGNFDNNSVWTSYMTVDGWGNVGIGTTTPAAKLDVEGTGNVILNAGNVGVGTNAPAQKLSVAGVIESTSGGVKFPDGTTQTTRSGVVQVVNYSTNAYSSISTVIPHDDTIPQNTEGTQWATLTITPKSATNKLMIDVIMNIGFNGNASHPTAALAALFQDSTSNALALAEVTRPYAVNRMKTLTMRYYMTAGTTNATTFKVRLGRDEASNVVTVNGTSDGRVGGGSMYSSITITEIAP